MNKLVFNEGGQPVCLDDLKMLQENMVELVMSLFVQIPWGSGSDIEDDEAPSTVNNVCWSTARHRNGCADANIDVFQAHKLITKDGVYDVDPIVIHDGEIYPDGATEWRDGMETFFINDAYYVLSEEVVESRVFKDGQERPVVKKCTAKLVGKRPTSGEYYKFTEVKSFDDMLYYVRCKNADNANHAYTASFVNEQ